MKMQAAPHRSLQPLLRSLAGLVLMFSAAFAQAAITRATVLDYSGLAQSSEVSLPQSAFHDWTQAEQEADVILAAWSNEPMTLAWTRIQLERYVKHKVSPTRGARGLALMHVAMHDALLLAEAKKLDAQLAVSMAASRVLGYQFPAEERAFDRTVFALAAKRSGVAREALSEVSKASIALGHEVGERVVARAETDGAQRGWNGSRLQWYGDDRYYGPGSWEPTAPYFYYPPDEPFAPGWKTWVLARADQFRPTPPAYGSKPFMKALREVLEVNAKLTEKQLEEAHYWVDGHGSVTPPGHWNQIALEAASSQKMGDLETAELFAVLNMAMADTFIAVWDAKYHYWTSRPVTAAKRLLNVDFQPAILTPPFPSFVAGHAGFSGAAARVLSRYFPKQAQRFTRMGKAAAHSRLLGGIHYRFDNEAGLKVGRQVADAVLKKYQHR